MSSIQITASQIACSPLVFPSQAFQLNRTSTFRSAYLGTKLPKISLKLTSGTSRYRKPATVCLFGGKDKSENGDEASPWKALENAMANFKKDQSIEDVLRQQIQKQDYFDDDDDDDEGSGGKGRGGRGGGGGGGDGSGGADDEGLSGMFDEFVQAFMATFCLLFLYVYILRSQDINVLGRDLFRFILTRKMSVRLKRLVNKFKKAFRRKKVVDDPYWLEREILNTPTWFDHPAKLKLLMKSSIDSKAYGDQRYHT